MPVTTLDPKTALVVIDLQNALKAFPGTPYPLADVIARSAELAEGFRKRGLPVVLVRVSIRPDGADWVPGRTDEARRMSLADAPEGADQIIDELAGHPEDIIVTKRNWGAFHGTDLDIQLRRRGITQVVITGVATSAGVESTARAAHEHGYHVTIPTDAVTDSNPDLHDRAVTAIFPRLAETGTTADILNRLP
ncbi:isochorismatase family protein [Kribbella sp. NBC_01505]|uniref:isochorismatase family protein n=1 Tax=Kribbella sp. NBC_01505 TaxID=2903580 RepID=UPI003870936C